MTAAEVGDRAAKHQQHREGHALAPPLCLRPLPPQAVPDRTPQVNVCFHEHSTVHSNGMHCIEIQTVSPRYFCVNSLMRPGSIVTTDRACRPMSPCEATAQLSADGAIEELQSVSGLGCVHMTLAALAACVAHNVQFLASVEANQHSLHLRIAKMRIRPSWDGHARGWHRRGLRPRVS